jgi:predicted SAM-dependent methyltransferase
MGPWHAAIHSVWQETRILLLHWRGAKVARKLGEGVKLNIGAGSHRMEGWVNVDLGRGEDVSVDVRRQWPFETGTVRAIHAEHLLEHLQFPNEVSHFLTEAYRVLSPGGHIDIGVPDAGRAAEAYCRGELAAFMGVAWLMSDWATTPMEQLNYMFRQDGEHFFAFDEETLRKALLDHGFDSVSARNWQGGLDSPARRWDGSYTLYMSAERAAQQPWHTPRRSVVVRKSLRRRALGTTAKSRNDPEDSLFSPGTLRMLDSAGIDVPPWDDIAALQNWLVDLRHRNQPMFDVVADDLNVGSRSWLKFIGRVESP